MTSGHSDVVIDAPGSPLPLDPALAAVAAAVVDAGLPPLVTLDPTTARQRIRDSLRTCRPGPAVASVADVVVPDGTRARLYRPTAPSADRTIVHFHGGGWVTGDLDYADATVRHLAEATGAPVLSVDYRLAPEHPYPSALDDATAALRWVASGDPGLPTGIVVSGDSAGANLAAVCAARAHDASLPILGQLLVYPVLDTDAGRASYTAHSGVFLGSREMAWFLDHYCPDTATRVDPSVAPVRAALFRTLPPTVVVVGGHDPLHDEGVEYADRLADAGVDCTLVRLPSLPHGFLQFTAVSDAACDALTTIADAARRLVAASPIDHTRTGGDRA